MNNGNRKRKEFVVAVKYSLSFLCIRVILLCKIYKLNTIINFTAIVGIKYLTIYGIRHKNLSKSKYFEW